MHWSERTLAVLDFETTGLDTANDRIVEAALLFAEPDGSLDSESYHVIVNPGVPIPKAASDVHGITDERARDEGVTPADAMYAIGERLWGYADADRPLVIYNAQFDWPLLEAEYDRHAPGTDAGPLAFPPLFDPLVVDRAVDRYRKGSRKLADVAAHYGVDLGDAAHSADADGVAAAQLARALVRRYEILRDNDLDTLQKMQAEWFAAWRDNYNEYRARRGMEPISGEWPAA